MPTKLHRYYGAGYLHFITTSCYRRSALLGTPQNRDLFLGVLEQVRRRYGFVVVGYVVMPEHVHLLFSEPERGDPSVVMKVLKQSFTRRLLKKRRATNDLRQSSLWDTALTEGHVWQHRFYDFVVLTERNEWRNSATCTAIRWCAAWCWRRNSGIGAATVTTPPASLDRCWSTKRAKR